MFNEKCCVVVFVAGYMLENLAERRAHPKALMPPKEPRNTIQIGGFVTPERSTCQGWSFTQPGFGL